MKKQKRAICKKLRPKKKVEFDNVQEYLFDSTISKSAIPSKCSHGITPIGLNKIKDFRVHKVINYEKAKHFERSKAWGKDYPSRYTRGSIPTYFGKDSTEINENNTRLTPTERKDRRHRYNKMFKISVEDRQKRIKKCMNNDIDEFISQDIQSSLKKC